MKPIQRSLLSSDSHFQSIKTSSPAFRKASSFGEIQDDGTIYAGQATKGGRSLYVASESAPSRMTWREAIEYAEALRAHGHNDWRLPSKDELRVLSKGALQIGGFHPSANWHWTGESLAGVFAAVHSFHKGSDDFMFKRAKIFVRCVRS